MLLEECQGSSNAGRRLERALIERPCPLPEPARGLGARSRSCNAGTGASPPAGSTAAITRRRCRGRVPLHRRPASRCSRLLLPCADVARQRRRLRPPHVSTGAALALRPLFQPADPHAHAARYQGLHRALCTELAFFLSFSCPPAAPSSRPRAGCTRWSMPSRQPRATA